MNKNGLKETLITAAVLFAASVAAVLASIVCMLLDVKIWHTLMPRTLVVAAITGLFFVVSLFQYRFTATKHKDSAKAAEIKEMSPAEKRKTEIINGFKISAGVCFLCAVILTVAAHFCDGITKRTLVLTATIMAFVAIIIAVVAVVFGRRSTAEKSMLVGLISIPLMLFIMFVAVMLVFGGALMYIMIASWAQWGLL